MTDLLPISDLTVNQTITLHPATVSVFSRHGIDSCCGGDLRVVDAAVRHNIDPDALLNELIAVAAGKSDAPVV
jgi:iron-sulfur cluster repair protein YtfE (RIC family)